MHIVYCTTLSYPSAFANRLQVMKMAEAFARITHFKLVVSAVSGAVEHTFAFYGIRSPFEVQKIGPLRRPRSLTGAFLLRKIIQKSSPDTVFYIREILPAFFLTFISSRFRKNFFLEVHSFARHHRFVYRRLFRYARGIITTSDKKAGVFRNVFCVPSEKILVRGNALDAEAFRVMPEKTSARTSLGLPLEKKIILLAGKPTAERAIDNFMKAAADAPQDFLFVSVGGSQEEIARLRNEEGFSRVQFVERVLPQEVVIYMAASDIILVLLSGQFPEISEYASPLKAREGLASGIPTIFSDFPALRDIADDKMTTFVTPDDSARLLSAIEGTLTHYPEAVAKAESARTVFLHQSWQNRAEDIVRFMRTKM